jgi:hypothetical protein
MTVDMTSRAAISGSVQIDTMRKGVEKGKNKALLMFRLKAIEQTHSIYARGMPALAMARYAEVIGKTTHRELRVTVELSLFAVGDWSLPFAERIFWYVYGDLREQAEALIRRDKQVTFDGQGIPPNWPRTPLFG